MMLSGKVVLVFIWLVKTPEEINEQMKTSKKVFFVFPLKSDVVVLRYILLQPVLAHKLVSSSLQKPHQYFEHFFVFKGFVVLVAIREEERVTGQKLNLLPTT